MDEGLALWNEAAGWRLSRDASEASAGLVLQFDDAPEAFRGIYDDERGTIFINRRLDPEARRITIAHELGHAFGLVHIDRTTRESLMNPGNVRQPPTEHDVNDVFERWGGCAGS